MNLGLVLKTAVFHHSFIFITVTKLITELIYSLVQYLIFVTLFKFFITIQL